jgi:hypothetical protein
MPETRIIDRYTRFTPTGVKGTLKAFTGRYFEKRASQQTDQSAKMKD